MSSYELRETPFGFEWGPVSIERLVSDDGWGVMFSVKTPREKMDIRVTPSGLIRLGKVVKAGRPKKS